MNKDMTKKPKNYSATKLAPQLAELMKMLFNVETYRFFQMTFLIGFYDFFGLFICLSKTLAGLL